MADGPSKIVARGLVAVWVELEKLGWPADEIEAHLDNAQENGPLSFAWLIHRDDAADPDALRYIDGDFQIEEGGPWVYRDEEEDRDGE